jgi:hypothetical protein
MQTDICFCGLHPKNCMCILNAACRCLPAQLSGACFVSKVGIMTHMCRSFQYHQQCGLD